MVELFNNMIVELPELLKELETSIPMKCNSLRKLPECGIYVLYEKEKPIYVGRSNCLRKRIQQQKRPSSDHNHEPFAFNLAKKQAAEIGRVLPRKRTECEKVSEFNALFIDAKKRVSEMEVRVVEIKNPELQTIFEVYAAMALNTMEYNSFENH